MATTAIIGPLLLAATTTPTSCTEIIPRYDAFDGAHRRDHVGYVIDESLKLAEHYGLDRDMVYTVAKKTGAEDADSG